jgi:hypothetical protein
MTASAAVLPAPSTFVQCTATPIVDQEASTCSTTGKVDMAFATAIVDPFVSLTAESLSAATAGDFGLHAAAAQSNVDYSFQVTGGNPGDIVPILIATSLQTLCTESVTSRCYAFAGLTITTSAVGTKTLIAVCTDGTCGTTATSFFGTLSTFARSGAGGDLLSLDIAAAASGYFSAIDEFASATADPHITIDPAFPNASLYSIVVSPGVGNELAPVPEPEMLYLASTALGALGLLVLLCYKRTI